jgi:fibronectin-binding autotransporter adhesin
MTKLTHRLSAILAIACALSAATRLHAGSHTWSGAVNGNWSNAGNWSAGGVPVIGESSITISFPVSATRKVMTNDIGALTVTSMNFSGSNYVLRGASTITFGSSLINVLSSGDSNVIESTLSLPGAFAVSVSDNKVMAVHTLTGSGYVVKFGEGELHLRGTASNPLSGGYIVNVGTLRLAKTGLATAVIGPLTIVGTTNLGQYASVWLEGSDQISIATDITIHPTGILNLNGKTNTISNLTVMAGSVYGSGLLALEGDLRLSAIDNSFPTPDISPLIQGNLEFNGAFSTIIVSNSVCEIVANIVENGGVTALNKTGPGTLWLKGGGNFSGNLNVQAGTVRAEQNTSLGSVAGLTTVSSGASLILAAGLSMSESFGLAGDGVNGQGALQAASGVVECFGNVTLTNTATVRVPNLTELQLKGVISGTGGLKKIGEGELHLAGLNANTFSGASFVNGGKLSLFKPANFRAIGSVTVTNGALLAVEANEQIDNAGVLSIYSGGVVNLTNRNETIGGLNLGGAHTLDTGAGTLTTLGNIFAGAPYSTNFFIPAVVRGNLSLGGGLRSVVASNNNSFMFDCAVSDGAGVGGLYLEYGNIWLLRSNSFTGPVMLGGGNFHASNNWAFGASSGGVIVSNSIYVQRLHLHASAVSVSGETMTLENAFYVRPLGTNAWNGPIHLNPGTSLGSEGEGAAELTLGGPVSGSNFNLYVTGGTLRLSGANTHTGVTSAYGDARLIVANVRALGTTNGGTVISDSASLELNLPNGAGITNEALQFASWSGYTNYFRSSSGVSNTWHGPVSMSSDTVEIQVPTSSVLNLVGAITGFGRLVKSGLGNLYLSGGGANTFSGDTVATSGYLFLNKPNGVQAVSNLAVQYPARLQWLGSEQIADTATLSLEALYFSGVTNAHLRGHSETLTDLALISSRVDASGGALTLLGDVDLTHDWIDSNFNSIFGTVRLGPGEHQVFSTVDNPNIGFGTLHLWDSVQETGGSAGLTVRNAALGLSGSNSFTGILIVDGSLRGGSLGIRHPHAFGSPAQGTLLTNSATMDLAMPSGSVVVGESLVLANRRPGTTQPCAVTMLGEYTNTWAGPITLLETNLFQITLGSKLTVDGTISGPAPLYVEGSAELILAGTQPNTFSDLVVSGGSLVRLAKPAGIHAFTGNLIMNDATYGAPHTVILEAPNQFPPQTVASIGVGGTNASLNLNGHAATIRRLLGFGTVEMGAGALTISNSTAQYSDFMGRLQSAPGGLLRHQGIGTQRGGTFALNGAAWLQGGTMYFDTGYIQQGLDISAGAVMDMYSPQALFGSLSGAGKLITSSGIIYVGDNNASTTFSGVIEGAGNTNLVKMGTGTLTLAGTSTHAGKMPVWNGTLLVNGKLPGAVHVEPFFGGVTATLGGTGVLGNVVITGTGARISPGATTAVPSYGKLTVTNIALNGGAIYLGEIGGTNAGVNLDQIEAKDTTTLINSGADFTTFGSGVVSNRYTVWKSFATVNGTFTSKSEGSTFFPSAGRSMKITYVGGASGRDIVLMDLSAIPPGSFSGIQVLPNGHVQVGGTGTPGALYDVQANANLNTTNWVLIGTALANFNGAFSFVDTNAPSFPMRFYRFLLP